MKVLVIGNGGREDALCRTIAKSSKVKELFCLPGNGGTAKFAVNVAKNPLDVDEVCAFVAEKAIDLTVIGPEGPLAVGLSDALRAQGCKVFAPSKAAAEIESSKELAKKIMLKYNIPTADYQAFSKADEAKAYIKDRSCPIVIKADGLAAGKGVIVAETKEQANAAISDMLENKAFGIAGSRVVIEEFLAGEEVSILAFIDGEKIVPMVSAQDHKRIFDGDKGPNTGGMGAYSPAPVYTQEIAARVEKEILQPIAKALVAEGRYYQGVIYAGLMITADGPKVVEFNARFGDPEAQAVLPRLDSDLVDIMQAVLDGTLQEQDIKWNEDASVCVVMVSGGYPGSYEKGKLISGTRLAEEEGAVVYHAGTDLRYGEYFTAGGRVLGVCALGKTIAEAVEAAYKAVEKIEFDGQYYRKDIAYRALNR
ncbi:MAG: phosphoribosylamine--glycine ligase [Clostridia bacterium]|nr:phosphoribosylamine--glycine ligase [Clostridia bacterium]MDD4798204.1 phosphoribosylamine--glycine ligase [Clostridia bacterium]